MVETYLRRGQRTVQRAMLEPRLRAAAAVAAYGGSGFLLSGAGLAGAPQPLAAGMICAGTGWRALVMGLGAMAGYLVFWGMAGRQGMVWAAATSLLALLLGKRQESQEQPLMLPAIAAFLTAVAGVVFPLVLREPLKPGLLVLRTAVTFGSGVLFTQAARQREAMTGWLLGAVAVLALARLQPFPWLGLGYVAAGLLGVWAPFPAAVLAGVGLDLSRVTQVPMTAVLSAAGLIRMIPFDKKWQHYASAGFACAGVMAAGGIWDFAPVPGLLLGGGLAALLPPHPGAARRRGETGVAQVRLELGASALGAVEQALGEAQPPPVDREAVLLRAWDRACGGCPDREGCRVRQTLTPDRLEEPDCPGAALVRRELSLAKEQLRCLQRCRQRQEECRSAVRQQYRFLEEYLRQLADQLPRSHKTVKPRFRAEISCRSRGKEKANGDRCLGFPGPGCRYYLLLCDGMGTGLEAAREGASALGLLRQLLCAGFSPEQALRSVNSLLVLGDTAGAVTVDLAQIRLDTGQASVYKWGAAPSWVLRRTGYEKIGTATPPPGIGLEDVRETVEKLSLCRGEALILLSDGVDGEAALHRLSLTPDTPPGELAAKILENGCREAEDDATAAVIRLRPVSLGTS